MSLAALLKSPITWIAAAVLAAAVGIWFVYYKGETAGAASVTTAVQQRTIDTQRKITNAEDHGPRTPGDVSKRLRDGSF